MLTAPQIESAVNSRIGYAIAEHSPLLKPVRYTLEAGHAKRVRPIMCMLSAQLFANQITSEHLNAALAVELFHNFTLVHDDIMDNADLRRGIPSLHKRFSNATAILAGDALLVKAYEFLVSSPNSERSLSLLLRAAIEVCEGQQLDMDYQSLPVITDLQYYDMIGKKTSALMAASCAIGAIAGNASEDAASRMHDFGYNLGITFQLQDDYLDAYGNAEFGKTIGGDIVQCKKTALFACAYKHLHEQRKQSFLELYNTPMEDAARKVESVMFYYDDARVEHYSAQDMAAHYQSSMDALSHIVAPPAAKHELERFAHKFLGRTN
jgi:geranylgeranyl diphosphate synthase type II